MITWAYRFGIKDALSALQDKPCSSHTGLLHGLLVRPILRDYGRSAAMVT